jgi:hypothetical protein
MQSWIVGTWQGEYAYGPMYGDPPPDPVPFRMSLSTGWFGRFAGYVRDDASRGGMSERGRIRGKVRGEELFFRKVMPVGYAFDDGGDQVSYDDLARQLDIPRSALPTHHVIEYYGRFDGQQLRGSWRIPPLHPDQPASTGTWSARRQSEMVDQV